MITIYSIYLIHIYNIFSSAEDLLTQTQIKYGCLGGGSTFNFFKVNIFYGKNILNYFSQSADSGSYQQMYQYMDTNEDVLTSSNKEGIERVKESKGGVKQRTK